MMKKRILIISLLACLCSLGAKAQNVSDLIISEALAVPDSTGILDDYGARNGWIEILNTSQGTVTIGGCFLTDDKSNLKKSLIPKSDSRTQILPRQVMLFYASGNGAQGTFYTDFKVQKGSTVYLVSNDGRTIIDSLVVPANLPDGMSVAKFPVDAKQIKHATSAEPCVPTPRILNDSVDSKTKAQQMAEKDPHGFILTIVSVSVVFLSLAILWFLFTSLFKDKSKQTKKEAAPKKKASSKDVPMDDATALAIALALEMEQGGDDIAAIAMALHLHLTQSVHDAESFVVTFQQGNSSAWRNKQLNFRQLPR